MKISALFCFLLIISSFSAQVLESDDYNSYNLGDVGNEFTGLTPGQGGMYLYYGSAPDYQIATVDASHGKSLKITDGNTTATTSNRYVLKDGLQMFWDNRTSGNNILKGTFSIYTGTSTGVHNFGSVIYASDNTALVGLRYNTSTKTWVGSAKLVNNSNNSVGFYTFTDITTNTYPANTWITASYAYDYVNGAIYFFVDGHKYIVQVNGYSVPPGYTPKNNQIMSVYGAGNNAVNTSYIDDYKIEAISLETLGSVEVKNVKAQLVSLYPNPTTDFINILTESKIISVNIYDTSGKKTNTILQDKQVDVRNLAKGVYILNVTTENGTESVKFIKK